VQKLVKNRAKFGHKGTFGKTMLATGSYGKMGAAVLSSRSCLRAGTGLLTLNIPSVGYQILQVAVPEAMVIADELGECLEYVPDVESYDAIGCGPGIGTSKETTAYLKQLMKSFKKPMVLDADALNIISQNPDLLDDIPTNAILTPHAKEFERLTKPWSNSHDRIKLQIEFSKTHNVFVVFKGAFTTVSCPDGELHFNSTGNPGMATAGSGDVLTGIITALLGQKYPPKVAAILGIYVHGYAGDLALEYGSMTSLIASDIIDNLPGAYKEIESWKTLN
jgi:NAD(P)H-hydrate epimerase